MSNHNPNNKRNTNTRNEMFQNYKSNGYPLHTLSNKVFNIILFFVPSLLDYYTRFQKNVINRSTLSNGKY